jgi:hypothetical protein
MSTYCPRTWHTSSLSSCSSHGAFGARNGSCGAWARAAEQPVRFRRGRLFLAEPTRPSRMAKGSFSPGPHFRRSGRKAAGGFSANCRVTCPGADCPFGIVRNSMPAPPSRHATAVNGRHGPRIAVGRARSQAARPIVCRVAVRRSLDLTPSSARTALMSLSHTSAARPGCARCRWHRP